MTVTRKHANTYYTYHSAVTFFGESCEFMPHIFFIYNIRRNVHAVPDVILSMEPQKWEDCWDDMGGIMSWTEEADRRGWKNNRGKTLPLHQPPYDQSHRPGEDYRPVYMFCGNFDGWETSRVFHNYTIWHHTRQKHCTWYDQRMEDKARGSATNWADEGEHKEGKTSEADDRRWGDHRDRKNTDEE